MYVCLTRPMHAHDDTALSDEPHLLFEGQHRQVMHLDLHEGAQAVLHHRSVQGGQGGRQVQVVATRTR